MDSKAQPFQISEHLAMGAVRLKVADLSTSLAYYGPIVGLQVLHQSGNQATLGVGQRALLILDEQPGATPAPPSATGLYHFALLLPNRSDLARAVYHWVQLNVPFGFADHLVSEAFYLNDPDGHGIEVYIDRPRDQWPRSDDGVRMANDPIDFDSLMGSIGEDASFNGLPDGTVMGHVHLRIGDVAKAEEFYVRTLGFDVMARWPGALFVSAGGYHHHLGLNSWQSFGNGPAPDSSAALVEIMIYLPQDDLNSLSERLKAAGLPVHPREAGFAIPDPWQTLLVFLPLV